MIITQPMHTNTSKCYEIVRNTHAPKASRDDRVSQQPMASRPLAYWPQPLAEQATKKIKTVQKFLDSPKSTSYKADKN